MIDESKVLAYIFVDVLSFVLILVLNKVKHLDEIKYRTPEKNCFVKELCLFLGVYYYSHYLFTLGFYIKFFMNPNK